MRKFIFTFLTAFAFVNLCFGQKPKPRPIVKRPVVGTIQSVATKTPVVVETKPLTLGISIERYVSTTDVNADGTATETWEMLQRASSPYALEKISSFERVFNGDLERAEILEAYVLKAGGGKIPVPAEAIEIKPTAQAEAAPTFSSLKIIQVKFGAVAVGDAVFMKIRFQKIKPHFPEQFDDIEIFPAVYEWKSVEINVTAPANFPLYTQAENLEGGRLADENGRARWHWEKKNLPAMELETAMYDFYSSSPKLAITSFKNFEELGAAYWTEAESKTALTPEIRALADEITKDIKDPQQQAAAIYEWVNKNVRYLSIVLERGGWIPHESASILANRYGDCKDYTTILHSLLKAKNIESYPVIIRADMTDWFPSVAVPSFFNHAILYIPSIDLFADATAPNTRLGLIPQLLVGKRAFLAGAKNGVIKIPDGRPEDNQLLSDIKIDFAADGSLKAVSKNIYQGRAEILFRPMFADSQIQKNSAEFVKYLLAFYGVDGTGRILKVGNPFKVGEPFDVELEVEQNNYTTFNRQGFLHLPVAINITNMLALEEFVKAETRKTNLLLGATRIRENFQLKFPEGVSVESVPAKIDFSNALGSYRNEFVQTGDTVAVVRELVIKKDIITAQEYPQIRELINKMVESFNGEIKYQSSAAALNKKGKPAKGVQPPARLKSFDVLMAERMSKTFDEKLLTARQVAQLETKLKTEPDDLETRKTLLHYYKDYRVKSSPAREAAVLRHRLWFVQKFPELESDEVYGRFVWDEFEAAPEYETVKTEWLKQIEANKTNARIRLNAAKFIRQHDLALAEKILFEGEKLDAENYELPLLLNQINQSEADSAGNKDKLDAIKERRLKAFESGEAALSLLKRERSSGRDAKRRDLLKTLSKTALRLERFDRAKALATELILDFGQSTSSSDYDDATHAGNIVLGLAALREGNIAKAKEYLLIAIRAPLRQEHNYLSEIDTELARELFGKGEKDAVAEYLRLCESLWNIKTYTDLYAGELKALQSWQEQIKQGKTPSFDFDKP